MQSVFLYYDLRLDTIVQFMEEQDLIEPHILLPSNLKIQFYKINLTFFTYFMSPVVSLCFLVGSRKPMTPYIYEKILNLSDSINQPIALDILPEEVSDLFEQYELSNQEKMSYVNGFLQCQLSDWLIVFF